MAITLIRTWQNGLASSGPALPRYTPWLNTSSASRNVVWVDSASSVTADGTEDKPYTTLALAIADAAIVTNESPIIVIKSGHTEVVSSAITAAEAGLTIIGLGSGSTKPSFTNGQAGACLTMSGVRQTLYNCRFPASTAASTSRVNATGDVFHIEDCDFTSGTNDTSDVALLLTNHNHEARGCTFTSSGTTTTRPNSAINCNVVDNENTRIIDCSLYAGVAGWEAGIALSRALDFKIRNLTCTGVYSEITIATGSRGWIAGVTGPGVVQWTV